MRIRTTSLLFILLFKLFSTSSGLAAATNTPSLEVERIDSIPILIPADSILLQEDQMAGQLTFVHTLKQGQSLYRLANYYGLSVEDIYLLNAHVRGGYKPGDAIKITMPPVAIKNYVPYDSIEFYVPVFWRLEKGQTLYGLTHRLLKLPSEEALLKNNPRLDVAALKVGQQLFVGWLPIKGISKEMQGAVGDPYVRMNKGLRLQWITESQGKRLLSNNGKAAWSRNGDGNKFMALHRTAPLNSLIEIMDKRTGKTLYCRVVGRVPDQVYDQNVQVVVSPLLVKAFGVRDRFFYVQVKHY